MSSRKRKKVRKMRGSKTHGMGAKSIKNGSGNRGGVGKAGVFKHRKSWIFKYEPNKIGGKKGFSSKKKMGVIGPVRAINLRDIARLAQTNEIDLQQFGYDKVLSSGELSKPLTIKAKFFSAGATEKIEKAGGKAVKE